MLNGFKSKGEWLIDKPFFLKIAIPKVKEDWVNFIKVTAEWVSEEKDNTEAWYEHGYAHEMLLKDDKALAAYQKSLAIDKNNSDALFRMGIINNKLGLKEEAIKIHTSLNNLNPARADELDEIINCKTNC